MSVKKLVIDVMVGDRFYCTLRMPITFDVIEGYNAKGGEIINYNKIVAYVLEKRPTLIKIYV